MSNVDYTSCVVLCSEGSGRDSRVRFLRVDRIAVAGVGEQTVIANGEWVMRNEEVVVCR
jgi:hypothetical protein